MYEPVTTFAQAKVLHRAGQLREAEKLYRRVVADDDTNLEALHLLAVVCDAAGNTAEAVIQLERLLRVAPDHALAHNHLAAVLAEQGQFAAAIPHFKEAVRLKPDWDEPRANLQNALASQHNRQGLALAAEGKLALAEEAFRAALAVRPDDVAAHGNLGNLLSAQGKPDEAARCYRRVLELAPHTAEAHLNLGLMLVDEERLDEAISCFERALQLRPQDAMPLVHLGKILRRRRQLPRAADCFRRALALRPDLGEAADNLSTVLVELDEHDEAEACCRRMLEVWPQRAASHGSLGNVLLARERILEAVDCYRNALVLDPQNVATFVNLGNALAKQHQLEEAEQHCRRAIELDPGFAEAYVNLGNVLKHLGQAVEAEACQRRAIELAPRMPKAYFNLGFALSGQDRTDEAIAAYRSAIALDPDYAAAHVSLAIALLALCRFAEAWPEYEWRLKVKQAGAAPDVPRWDGSSPAGRTILVRTEQGNGDSLQFIRYTEWIKRQGGRVIVECPRPLARLLATCAGVDEVIVTGEPRPACDAYIPLMSLPGAMGATFDNIPAATSYLSPDENLVAQWKSELDLDNAFKIGIAWQGNPTYSTDRLRSIPLAYFAGLARIRGVRLVCLQMGPGREQLAEFTEPILDLGERLGDFHNTAAIVRNLDLVVSSDTAPVHLAGAIGAPVWVALSWVADWRWFAERDDSPWYPTMKLFRQSRAGDWPDVFRRIEQEVARRVREGTN